MYQKIIRPLLFQIEAETIHNIAINAGELLGECSFGRKLVSTLFGPTPPDISTTVDGINYRSPVLLAAGFDYNGRLTQILPSLGLGGEEIGSITALPSLGNRRPRLSRLPEYKSLVVNKGLANDGVEVVIKRLKASPQTPGFVRGISIARSNRPEASSVDAGIADYRTSLSRLTEENVGDYYTINISCPNAHGGETFTSPVLASKLLKALDKIDKTKPRYVKMPISLDDGQFFSLLGVLDNHLVDGIIIGNLQKDRSMLEDPSCDQLRHPGGLSGLPTQKRSDELIKKTKAKYTDRFTIIGCGGIFTPEDALTKLRLGADLLQLITGMIYEGPGLIQKINKRLSAKYEILY